MLFLIVLVLYILVSSTVYQLLITHEDKWKSLGLLVPEFTRSERRYYQQDYAHSECLSYSAFWLFTLPVTALHYYVVVPFVNWIGGCFDKD